MNKALPIAILFLLPFVLKAQSFIGQSQFSIFKPAVIAQYSGFLLQPKDTVLSLTKKKHSPRMATIFSAVLPGLGQAYNKKYWKIPLVYAGLLGSGYFIQRNRDSMLERQSALKVILDGDSMTNPAGKYANISIDQLRADRNYYRTNRDYSIIAFGLIYFLNIIDATVDAHFYNFNIDKPLSQQKTRHWYFASSKVQNKPTIGLAYRF